MLEIILKSLKEFAKTNQKTNQKSDQKILSLLKKNSTITINELSKKTGLSDSGIKRVLKKLKDEGVIKRVGGLKGGYWEVR